MKRNKNGTRECPYCGAILDPGEKCDCGGLPISEVKSTCDWCGATLIGPRFDISIGKEKSSVCFRCNLAILNTRTQRCQSKYYPRNL